MRRDPLAYLDAELTAFREQGVYRQLRILDSAQQANATFEAARCLENLKKIDAAKKLYQELVDQYPKSDKLDDAKKKLATLSAAG